jgi:hypothetical protein
MFIALSLLDLIFEFVDDVALKAGGEAGEGGGAPG